MHYLSKTFGLLTVLGGAAALAVPREVCNLFLSPFFDNVLPRISRADLFQGWHCCAGPPRPRGRKRLAPQR